MNRVERKLPMTQEDLKNIIAGGEDSRTEFKSVSFHNEGMAKAVVAFANMQGGRILVGVEDDGRISGVDHPAEQVERLVSICRNNIIPPLIPDIRYQGCDLYMIH